MHDPLTVAFTIRSPIRRPSPLHPKGYRRPWVTIFHRDPERDGSDGSCGWAYPKLTKPILAEIDRIVDFETQDRTYPTMFDGRARPLMGPVETIITVFSQVAWQVFRWTLKPRELREALELASVPVDGLRSLWEHPPEEKECHQRERVQGLYRAAAQVLLRSRRPWWRHPRWHLHHWRIQVHVIQDLKRWLFSRCAGCGKRFPYGATVLSTGQSDGPRWFRSEPGIYCSVACLDAQDKPHVVLPDSAACDDKEDSP